jgi:hypothetical protein
MEIVGEKRRGEERRGEARRGEERRGEERKVLHFHLKPPTHSV